ncbi:hypothetical protein V8G61_11635 [Gaetbulibacter sp. M240]|uniref:hypothetical protein n=1 Tax=Gaetbulibacter sp. M240 TaxID=3126511 RepID=UPI00374EE926
MKKLLYVVISFNFLFGFSQDVLPVDFQKVLKLFPNVRDLAMSSKSDEALFSAQNILKDRSVLIYMKKKNEVWSKPEIVSFSGKFHDMEPFFSKDDLRLYFVSNRPLDLQTNDSKDFDIWYVQREHLDAPWSDPINLGTPINTKNNEFYPSLAENGNLYFTREDKSQTSLDDLYVSFFSEGEYTTPEKLPETINSSTYDYNAFIAPDESYIIFGSYRREDSFGSGDLYVSYKTEKGWTPAKNLGEPINGKKLDYSPFIDYQTNTFYFTSERAMEEPSHSDSLSVDILLKEFWKYSNGQSRLYKIKLDDVLDAN